MVSPQSLCSQQVLWCFHIQPCLYALPNPPVSDVTGGSWMQWPHCTCTNVTTSWCDMHACWVPCCYPGKSVLDKTDIQGKGHTQDTNTEMDSAGEDQYHGRQILRGFMRAWATSSSCRLATSPKWRPNWEPHLFQMDICLGWGGSTPFPSPDVHLEKVGFPIWSPFWADLGWPRPHCCIFYTNIGVAKFFFGAHPAIPIVWTRLLPHCSLFPEWTGLWLVYLLHTW